MNELDKHNKDLDYLNIINDIIKNEKFMKIKECRHHGITRLEHSIRVSYYSYKIAKFLKLNYNLSLDDARMILVEELKPKKEVLLDDEFEDEEDDNNENA